MGEVADSMIEGVLCATCGEYVGELPGGGTAVCGCDVEREETKKKTKKAKRKS